MTTQQQTDTCSQAIKGDQTCKRKAVEEIDGHLYCKQHAKAIAEVADFTPDDVHIITDEDHNPIVVDSDYTPAGVTPESKLLTGPVQVSVTMAITGAYSPEDAVMRFLQEVVGQGVNNLLCVVDETDGENVWIVRKGAIVTDEEIEAMISGGE